MLLIAQVIVQLGTQGRLNGQLPQQPAKVRQVLLRLELLANFVGQPQYLLESLHCPFPISFTIRVLVYEQLLNLIYSLLMTCVAASPTRSRLVKSICLNT